jgi:hypothetical protein
MTYQDYTQDTDKQFVAKFKSNGTLSETATYTMEITNEYAYNGRARLGRATIIKIEDNDATKDGELVWYVGETSSSQTASVTISNANVEWSYNTLTNFTVTRTGNTFTFTPKSTASEVEETFTVTTADGMVDELVLKVAPKKTIKTASRTLRFNYYRNDWYVSDDLVATPSENVTVSKANTNNYWIVTVSYIEGEQQSTNINFSYRGILDTYTKTMSIAEFLQLNNNTTVSLE